MQPNKELVQGFGLSGTVLTAIAKMRRGANSRRSAKVSDNKAFEIGSSSELRQAETLLHRLDTFILPELEDAFKASISSKTRQDQTHPERYEGLKPNSENPYDNAYAAITVSQSLDLTTDIRTLCDSTVIIVGLNGTGSKLATLLTRRGLGNLILFDPNHVAKNEWRHNLEFTPAMANLSKARAVCGIVSELNADTRVEAVCCDIRERSSGGLTLLAHCMKTGTAIISANYKKVAESSKNTNDVEIKEKGGGGRKNEENQPASIEVHILNVQTKEDMPRQVNTRLTYINRLSPKLVDLHPFDPTCSREENDLDLNDLKNLLPHKRNKNIVVVCCDEDKYAQVIVGELAMEYGLTALYTQPPQNITNRDTTENEMLATTTSVVPGVTACLQCQFSRRSNQHTHKLNSIWPLPARSPPSPPSCYSPATHAIIASTLCQAVLRALLSNMDMNKSVINSEFSQSNDRIETIMSEKPSRKCKSLHCRSQQHSRRKMLRKQQMRKVLKVSNMFAWTKKKNSPSNETTAAPDANADQGNNNK